MNMIEDVWQTRYRHPTQWDQAFAPLTLPDMFLGAAQRHPDAPFLDFLGRRYSYAAVAKAVRHAAAGFEALGIQPGDRVGLFLPNVPHYVAAYYGALLAGAIGGASARVMVASVVQEDRLELRDVMRIVEEASELRHLNERLKACATIDHRAFIQFCRNVFEE